ncbi:MAG: response regulator, partial [Planctomycetes bacterium]|nr:response regulator [Planctomycetota bacterium]
VRACYDGGSALDAVRADPPDVCLLDLMMPGLDGLELAGLIRSQAGRRPDPKSPERNRDTKGRFSGPSPTASAPVISKHTSMRATFNSGLWANKQKSLHTRCQLARPRGLPELCFPWRYFINTRPLRTAARSPSSSFLASHPHSVRPATAPRVGISRATRDVTRLTRGRSDGIIRVLKVTTFVERMTRALIHIGLAVALVLAPTLCCCKVRGLGTAQAASPRPQPTAFPAPVDSCHSSKTTSCCHEAPKHTPKAPEKPSDHKPTPRPAPVSCACCGERPDVAQTESKPTVAAAEPTGELLPPAVVFAAVAPEHLGLVRGLHPPDRADVDARSAALFDRHVMRC